MELVKSAAMNVLRNGFKLQKGETFIAVSDENNRFFSDALEEAAREIGAVPKTIILEDYGKRPATCTEKMLEIIRKADAGTICATEREGEVEKLRQPLYKGIRAYPVRFASMTGITREAIEKGLNYDFEKVASFSRKVFEIVKNAKEMRVVTRLGTDILIDTSRYKWVNCDGVLKEGVKDDNFPEGEVFTAPHNVNGKIVVDGVIGDSYDFKYGKIEKTPLTISIRNCKAVPEGLYCENKELERDIFEYLFNGDDNSLRVGEVALGTNIFIREIIGNLLMDEKFPSFHLAFGDCYGNDTGSPYESKRHIDMVILHPDVYADGKLIMKEGKYLNQSSR